MQMSKIIEVKYSLEITSESKRLKHFFNILNDSSKVRKREREYEDNLTLENDKRANSHNHVQSDSIYSKRG